MGVNREPVSGVLAVRPAGESVMRPLPLSVALILCALAACSDPGTREEGTTSENAAREPETVPGPAPEPAATPVVDAPEPAPREEPVLPDTEVVEGTERESAFDSDQWNTVVGLGGGAGGKYFGGHRVDREVYAAISEHGYLAVGEHPLATFAIDVDGASWSNVRRFLEDGRLPPPDAVRVEECVNWFRYASPPPAADALHPIAVHTDVAPCPWQPDHRLLRVVLRTRDVELDRLVPRNLVFLVDVSGSMRDHDKLPLLRRGLRLLARQMRPQDRVAIVTYAGDARVALEPTPGSEIRAIEDAIEGLVAGGSTNGAGGIRMAYDLAHANAEAESINRVLLATDGDFNVGISDQDELVRLIEAERDRGVFLSVLGFGTGNLQDAKLEALGRHGNGHYAYIDSIAEARRVLVEQSGATLVTAAKDVKVQVEFNPRHVSAYRQIGYENRALRARDFNDDRKDAGEMGAGHVVTALFELVPVGAEMPRPAVDPLRYAEQPPAARAVAEDPDVAAELLTVKVRYKHPESDTSARIEVFVQEDEGVEPDEDFRFASAVAAFAMILRSSPYVGELAFQDVIELARGARGEDVHGERAEFLKLAQMAADLTTTERQSR